MTAPSSYRPLCMLDNISKLLERLLLARLSMAVAANRALSDNQYGFRQGRGTIQAIEEVLSMADAVASGPTQDRDLLLLVTLDVRNAFNTVPWAAIVEAMRLKGVPEYMISMMRSYMTDRAVLVNDGDTQREMEKFCGVRF